jgi:ribosomal protein S18 acetylase RimI-like enzyme
MSARPTPMKAALRAPGSVVLRPGRPADIAALCAIEDRAFTHDRLSARSFARFLRSPGRLLIVADADGAVSGYALTLFRKRSRFARLYSLAVDPTVRRRKLGTRLLRAAEAAAFRNQRKGMRLEVKPGNRRALSLYRRFGYRILAELDGYYSDGRKALRLQKAFGGSNNGV